MAAKNRSKGQTKTDIEVEAKAGSDESLAADDKPAVNQDPTSESTTNSESATTDTSRAKPNKKPMGRKIAMIRMPIMQQFPELTDAELAAKISAKMKEDGFVYECKAEKVAAWRKGDSASTEKQEKVKSSDHSKKERFAPEDIEAVAALAERIGGDTIRRLLELQHR